ncbi:MAG: DUF1178 family protein [Alphaproteobacteria bacterium]|nr:DUF1178 family protein [Alphaproteobacteria bacterium]
MILFELKCHQEHIFESWFKDGHTYDQQESAKQISCPFCGSNKVQKNLMAPRISRNIRSGELSQIPEINTPPTKVKEIEQSLIKLRQDIETNCDYVGHQFAEEARKIHFEEVENTRGIYGEATLEEVKELNEEGIEFFKLPWISKHNA